MYVGSDLSLTLGYAVLGLAVRVNSQAYCPTNHRANSVACVPLGFGAAYGPARVLRLVL